MLLRDFSATAILDYESEYSAPPLNSVLNNYMTLDMFHSTIGLSFTCKWKPVRDHFSSGLWLHNHGVYSLLAMQARPSWNGRFSFSLLNKGYSSMHKDLQTSSDSLAYWKAHIHIHTPMEIFKNCKRWFHSGPRKKPTENYT